MEHQRRGRASVPGETLHNIYNIYTVSTISTQYLQHLHSIYNIYTLGGVPLACDGPDGAAGHHGCPGQVELGRAVPGAGQLGAVRPTQE